MLTDKIDKLIQLSENNDNENESLNAVKKAKQMIVDNDLYSVYREFLDEFYKREQRGLILYQEHSIEQYELNPEKIVDLPEVEGLGRYAEPVKKVKKKKEHKIMKAVGKGILSVGVSVKNGLKSIDDSLYNAASKPVPKPNFKPIVSEHKPKKVEEVIFRTYYY